MGYNSLVPSLGLQGATSVDYTELGLMPVYVAYWAERSGVWAIVLLTCPQTALSQLVA